MAKKELTTSQLAAKLGVSGALVRRWYSQGRIKGRRVGDAHNSVLVFSADTERPETIKPGRK